MAEDPKEYVSRVRYLPMSAKKVRRVADMIRGRQAEDALYVLQNTTKRAAKALETLLVSALANAKQGAGAGEVDRMKIHRLMVDGGPEKWNAKKWRPASMGRTSRIRKRTSHVTLALALSNDKGKKK